MKLRHSWRRLPDLPDRKPGYQVCRFCGIGPYHYRDIERGGLGECSRSQPAVEVNHDDSRREGS